MQLKYIKLSGFKSFVDSTRVGFKDQLICIVGPNGCGKSNIIDAIRWVMGESSAKTLRGDQMEDVIFNGSAARKAVNRASVELVFDNSLGRAPGPYAQFSEISIRRELVREGGSRYFINKNKCRRKDVHSIFLGTGLGPRSYSIIEQGMVGRIVESKPEELRLLIEEAAGISKYKARRRETENRIRHTRDNLSRVEDIMSELDTQLRRLKRQAREAERYKELKSKQRGLEKDIKIFQWHEFNQKLQHQDVEYARIQAELDGSVAKQRAIEADIDKNRNEHAGCIQEVNRVQADYYELGTKISSIEQSISHARETQVQHKNELERLQAAEKEAETMLVQDRSRLSSIGDELAVRLPEFEMADTAYRDTSNQLVETNERFSHWQGEWQELQEEAAKWERQLDVEQTKRDHHQRQIHHFAQRAEQVEATLHQIDAKLTQSELEEIRQRVANTDEACAHLESKLQTLETELQSLFVDKDALRERADTVRHRLQDESAQVNSLKTVHAAAIGEDDEDVVRWIESHGLRHAPRIASRIRVDNGWERAVDTVLDRMLNALHVDNFRSYMQSENEQIPANLMLVDNSSAPSPKDKDQLTPLSHYIGIEGVQIDGWLHGVFASTNLNEAMSNRHLLESNQSIVTKDGYWLGTNWMVFKDRGSTEGVLQREAEIAKREDTVKWAAHELNQLQTRIEYVQSKHLSVEQNRTKSRDQYRSRAHQRTELHNQLGRLEARNAELIAQRESLLEEQYQLQDQRTEAERETLRCEQQISVAEAEKERFMARKMRLKEQREQFSEQLQLAQQVEQNAREERQQKHVEYERLQSTKIALDESIKRVEEQLKMQTKRRLELESSTSSADTPEVGLQHELQSFIKRRLKVEQQLNKANDTVAVIETQIKERERSRLLSEQRAEKDRQAVESRNAQRQEVLIRRDTVSEELELKSEEISALATELCAEQTATGHEQQLAKVEKSLQCIGAVNLVAIDEFNECEERKQYLDKQHTDLSDALSTLEAAIHSIDKETKSRFKDTFDNLNQGLEAFFPRLFGGGRAYLEQTSDNLLETGVVMMARPPGKRNSNIHLLSGGEKALTAVALLFAFFELNPAPFCVLDEVDAPLDDANVERYVSVLKELGKKTQLLFITHNKLTMEAADVLVGVTMAEAGVSRLVAVDVNRAAAMAEA